MYDHKRLCLIRPTARYYLWIRLLTTLLLLQDNFSDSHCIRIDPPDRLLPIPNKNMEQIEPMDLSCGVKNKNSKAANKTCNEVRHLFQNTKYKCWLGPTLLPTYYYVWYYKEMGKILNFKYFFFKKRWFYLNYKC